MRLCLFYMFERLKVCAIPKGTVQLALNALSSRRKVHREHGAFEEARARVDGALPRHARGRSAR